MTYEDDDNDHNDRYNDDYDNDDNSSYDGIR